jgi:hypothetical protein
MGKNLFKNNHLNKHKSRIFTPIDETDMYFHTGHFHI